AERLAKTMLANHPNHPRAVFTLGHLAMARGAPEQAITILGVGLAAAPANAALRAMLIEAYDAAGDYRNALDEALTLREGDRSPQSLWTCLKLFLRYGKNDHALGIVDTLLSAQNMAPKQRSALHRIHGQLLRIVGEADAAIAAFRHALKDDGQNTTAWWGLADMKTVAFSNADVAELQRLVADESLTKPQRSLAAFSLAAALPKDMNGQALFAVLQEANMLQGTRQFDTARFVSSIERLVQAFTAETLQTVRPGPIPGAKPIFILGLPRSGSTLVEQILGSHPAIEATMEMPVIPALKRRADLLCMAKHKRPFINAVGAVNEAELQTLFEDYQRQISVFAQANRPFFTDKQPFNFEHIGFIHKLLPDAIILDIRRHPMDCGLSLYRHHFAEGVPFSYDLKAIGAYYRGYLTLMDHWDRVLPGRVFRIDYEALVHDPETVIRALLAHIGVDFDPACLAFNTTKRAVRTASSEQVRQPLNRKGIGRWQRYKNELKPLRDALGEDVLQRLEVTG
ncbi:MAG: sulfotransferase, partial [Pseudomonadota bacterium]